MLQTLVLLFCCCFCCTSCFNASLLPSGNACTSVHLEDIVRTYLRAKPCTSVVTLADDAPETLFARYTVPRYVKRINTSSLAPDYNMRLRPRRDHYDPTHQIDQFCPENGQGFVIVAGVVPEIRAYLHSAMVTPFWSPQASFYIYFTRELSCADGMRGIFERLWSIYKTPHVVIGGCHCRHVLFYNPFVGGGQLFRFTETAVLRNPTLLENSLLDLHGYPIRALQFRSPFSVQLNATEFIGIHVNLLNLLAQHLNFTRVTLQPYDNDQYGYKLPNGTYTGALGRLLAGDADFVMVEYFVKDYLTDDVEMSVSCMTDNLCVILRKAERIPDWQLLYHCMDEATWVAVIVAFFVMSFAWLLIQSLLTQFRDDAVLYPFVFTDTFRVLITSSLVRLPTITSERVFLAFCLMAAVTLVGAFQGALVGVYTAPMFYKDVDTLQALSRTDTRIKSRYMFFLNDVFSDPTYPMIAKLKSMTSFYNDTVPITYRVGTQRNFATLVRQSEVDVDTSTTTYYDANGINLVHMVRECPRNYRLAYPFPVNSPFAPRLNAVILRTAEAGLFSKWYGDMKFNTSESASEMRVPSASDALKVFSLKDMQISFYQLVIGYMLSSVVFLVERFKYLYKKSAFPEYN